MAIDTNESLEMTIEADADAAGKELDELIVKLGEVIAQLKKVKNPSQQGLIPGLQDALGNILDLRKQIAGLNVRRAKFAPDTKEWKAVDAQISEASYQLDKFVTTANDLLGKTLVPQVDTSKIEQAVQNIKIHGLDDAKEELPLYDGALSPPVEFDWDKFHAENEVHLKEFESFLNGFDDKDIEIRVEFTSELAQAQKHVTALENAIERNKHNMRKYQISGDDKRLRREAEALRTNETLLKRYEDAIRSASGAWSHMDDAGTIEIRNIEDYDQAERAAKRLEKSIENDTAAMHRFSAANDAAGVERMKAKLEGSIVALDRYKKALGGAVDLGKQRDQLRQLENLYADIEKIQKRIATSKGGDQMFVNNTASVRRLKLELLEAEREVRRLNKAMGAADTGGAFRQSAKYIGLSLVNMVKLRAEAKRGKKAVIDMSRALSLMAFRMAIRTVMRLTKEGIENLAKYSREVDNAFNGAVSRMMSKVTELKNSFAAAIAPVIQAIEPYVVRIANFLINTFNQLSLLMASLFGQKTFYKAIPVTEDYAESLDTAANSAKKLKKQLMGIDELTILQDPNEGASGVKPGLADPAEMFTIEKVADHAEDLQSIKDKLREALPYAIGIGTALAAWRIAPAVINGIETVSKLNKIFGSAKPMQLFGGGALAIGGGLLEGFSIADAIENGLNGLNFSGILGGGGLLAGGGALIGKALGSSIIGAAVGGIVAGIPAFVTGVYDALTGGLDKLNALLIPLGSTMAGAGIGAIIGAIGGPIGAGLGALIGLAIGALTDLGILVYQKWDEIVLWFDTNVAQPIGETFSGLWGNIQGIWSSASEWFNTNIIQPIAGFFSGLSTTIGEAFEGAWMVARAVWQIVSGWFNTNVIEPVSKAWNDFSQFVSGKMTALWQGIQSVWSVVSGWFQTNIINPLTQAWKTATEKIKGFFTVMWTAVKAAAAVAINSLISKVESLLNKVVSGINKLIGGFDKVIQWAAGVLGESWGGLTKLQTVSLGRVSVYGDGGFPSMGELFVARERGPEYVGRMGSRNAVANNDQIVQGIAYGVAEANDALITVAYAMADRIVQAIANKDMNTYIDTRKITTAQQNRSRAYGV